MFRITRLSRSNLSSAQPLNSKRVFFTLNMFLQGRVHFDMNCLAIHVDHHFLGEKNLCILIDDTLYKWVELCTPANKALTSLSACPNPQRPVSKENTSP